jgi:glycerate-2-kinase
MGLEERKNAQEIFTAALRASDPYLAVKSSTGRISETFKKEGLKKLLVVGAGKAATAMARALEEDLGGLINTGLVITKYDHTGDFRSDRIRAIEAGHPVPDENGLRATRRLLGLVEAAGDDTLVVCLLSGGGSALLTLPHEGITLGEKQEITGTLLRSGASIEELNAVRKHISGVKGGRLARLASPARVLSLIVSDVIGDRLEVIASGPTSPDRTTFQDALNVLTKYSIKDPESIIKLIERGAAGQVPDTPKEGDSAFARVDNIIVANNRAALKSALKKARELGYQAEIISGDISGDISQAARFLYEESQRHRERPACLISGGETTVVVKGRGTGGRNMHLALYFAMAIEGKEGITMLSAGTDGTDGPTDAAGAVIDSESITSARKAGIVPEEYFAEDDSYSFFKRTGDVLVTGPTGTNVMDIQVIILS